MDIRLIGIHYADRKCKSITGLRLFDADQSKVYDYKYENVRDVIRANKLDVDGLELDTSTGELKGSNGALERYPSLLNGRMFKDKVVILGEIEGIGYRICGAMGKVADAPVKDVLEMCNKIGIANGKLVTSGDNTIISSISGNYKQIALKDSKLNQTNASARVMRSPKSQAKQYGNIQMNPTRQSGSKEIDTESIEIQANVTPEMIDRAKRVDEEIANHIKNDKETSDNVRKAVGLLHNSLKKANLIDSRAVTKSKLKELDDTTGMTVEQKLAYVSLALRGTSPIYHTVWRCLEKVESSKEKGVKTMGVSLDTLYFSSDFVKGLTLPELLFVILHEMSHVAMNHRGREGSRDHDIWNTACDLYINKQLAVEYNIPGPLQEKTITNGDGTPTRFNIMLPRVGLYCDNVDINTDTPEAIYAEILKAIEDQQKQQQNGRGSSNGGGSSNDEGSGNSSGSSNDESSNSSNMDGTGDSGQDSNGNEEGSGGKDVIFRGQKIGKLNENGELVQNGDQLARDIVDDEKSANKSIEEKSREGTALQRRIMTMQKLAGTGTCGRLWDILLADTAPKVDWKRLLRNKLTEFSSKETSFMSPDKRFVHAGMNIPGYRTSKPDALKNIKICIDCSGSISDEDIGVAFNQIAKLFKEYKASGEVIFWHTTVCNIIPFSTLEEVLKARPSESGGTDANCVYNLFSTDKKYKRPSQFEPSCILMFTDGYISPLRAEFAKNKVFKDTIWIVSTSGDKNFKPLFGKVAPLKM